MENQSLSDAGIRERYDLQQLIRKNPQAFFADMKEKILLIGEELCPTDVVDDRVDLLAVDKNGAAVIIELKRGNNRLHLLQSLAYAAMISDRQPQYLIDTLSSFEHISPEEAKEKVESFLDEELSSLNQKQRIILLAEDFDYEVLATAQWLTDKYGLDIRCYQLNLATDGKMEFLSCTCIYPAPELREHAVPRGRHGESSSKWSNWDTALEAMEHLASKEFFRREVEAGCENNLNRRTLVYRLNGKRRFFVKARKQKAYVWQRGRFADDLSFWKKKLTSELEIEPVDDGKCLRFYIATEEDFQHFKQCILNELAQIEFISSDDLEGIPQQD